MHIFLDALGIELTLLFWVFLGSICGLAVELNTGAKKSSVLYHSKLSSESKTASIGIIIVNVLVGTIFAYAGTPFVAAYLNLEGKSPHFLGYFLGVASLSVVRAYAQTWKNKRSVIEWIFKLIDFMRSGK